MLLLVSRGILSSTFPVFSISLSSPRFWLDQLLSPGCLDFPELSTSHSLPVILPQVIAHARSQDDRDIRDTLKAQGLEPAYAFMIRIRLPGGVVTPSQWLAVDWISDEHGNSTFKITTRQTFQFHGIVKSHLKPAMQALNKGLMDTIGACGDVSESHSAC